MITIDFQTGADRTLLALAAWREARSLGRPALTAICEVYLNRLESNKWPSASLWDTIINKWAILALSVDRQLALYPKWDDPMWALALLVADRVIEQDASERKKGFVKGADSYYDATIGQPSWALKAKFVTQIGKLRFYIVGHDHETLTRSALSNKKDIK